MDEWYTTENGSLACEHGHQRRKCPYCESIWQDERIAELEQENERLRADRDAYIEDLRWITRRSITQRGRG